MASFVNSTDVSTKAVGNTVSLDLKCQSPRWVIVKNASAFFLTLNTKNNRAQSLMPGESDLYELENATGSIDAAITAQLSLTNPPATTIITVAYDQTEERPPGTYPTFNNNFVGIGNTVLQASQVFQRGQPDPTFVVFGSPQVQGQFSGFFFQINNDGSATFGQFGGIGPKTVSWDTGGNETVNSLTTNGKAALAAGNQETGFGAVGNNNGVTSANPNIAGVNPAMVWHAPPSSITFTTDFSTNVNAPFASDLTATGFGLAATQPANGFSRWLGSWVTVGL